MHASNSKLLQSVFKSFGTTFVAMSVAGSTAYAQSSVAGNEVLFGKTSSLSGPLSEIGVDATTATKAYFDYINARGGVHGRRIRLLTLDDSYSTEKGVSNAGS